MLFGLKQAHAGGPFQIGDGRQKRHDALLDHDRKQKPLTGGVKASCSGPPLADGRHLTSGGHIACQEFHVGDPRVTVGSLTGARPQQLCRPCPHRSREPRRPGSEQAPLLLKGMQHNCEVVN